MKKIIIITILLILVVANSGFSQKKTIINGNLKNKGIITQVVLENILSETKIDSLILKDDGKFSFQFDVQKSDFYRLKFDEQAVVFIVPEPGENIKVEVDIDDSQNPKITGSQNSELIYSTLGETQKKDKEIEDFTKQISDQKKEIIRKMIQKNTTSLSCLFFISELDPSEDAASYKLLAEGLKNFSDNPLVADLQTKIAAGTNLEIGSEAPDIVLSNPEGKEIKLSSLRGKFVLIDFWAAWCRPCRGESPNMVKMYNKFHKKGFEIYSVSLDNTKEDWVGAIEKDGLGAWTHVSDLKYWDSDAAKLYNVQSIPFTILIDKDGKIIAKELRGAGLETKLEEIFGK